MPRIDTLHVHRGIVRLPAARRITLSPGVELLRMPSSSEPRAERMRRGIVLVRQPLSPIMQRRHELAERPVASVRPVHIEPESIQAAARWSWSSLGTLVFIIACVAYCIATVA